MAHVAPQVAPVVKNPPANAGETRDVGSVSEPGRSLGGGKWQPTPVLLPGESHGGKLLPSNLSKWWDKYTLQIAMYEDLSYYEFLQAQGIVNSFICHMVIMKWYLTFVF